MKKLLAVVLAFALAAVASAQSAPVVEVITVSTTALSLATDTVGGRGTARPEARYCFLSLETAAVRWRVDGIAPTDSTGHVMASGSSLELYGHETISRFKVIRDTGSDGVLTASCWEAEPF